MEANLTTMGSTGFMEVPAFQALGWEQAGICQAVGKPADPRAAVGLILYIVPLVTSCSRLESITSKSQVKASFGMSKELFF
jgi:hypothetical protein